MLEKNAHKFSNKTPQQHTIYSIKKARAFYTKPPIPLEN